MKILRHIKYGISLTLKMRAGKATMQLWRFMEKVPLHFYFQKGVRYYFTPQIYTPFQCFHRPGDNLRAALEDTFRPMSSYLVKYSYHA